MKFIKLYILFVLAMCCTQQALSQTLKATGPAQVAVGEQFQVAYSIATQNVSNIRMGNVPSVFEVLVGPSTSTSSNFQMINGKVSSNESTTFTYVLMADKEGTFTIPAATATVGGKNVTSNSLRIVVSGKVQQQSGRSSSSPRVRIKKAGAKISGNELFITVTASKKRVYEQEPVLLTYKVYTLVELSSLDGKMPDLKGFHTQEITQPQQKHFSAENYNGKTYNVVTWSQYVMYPQITGKLTIPSITFHGSVIVHNETMDPFEALFNGGAGYSEVNKNINAPAVDIEVLPLPAKPKNFSGGVGKYSISSSVSATNTKSGEPITLKIVVSGSGNMKLLKEPEIKLPRNMDKYDAKVTDKTNLTANGVEGSMIYEYPCVPRKKGEYTIPAIDYTYYDVSAREYRTVSSSPIQISVAQGEESASGSDRETLQLLNSDIRYIKLGESEITANGQSYHSLFFLSTLFWILLALSLVAAIIVLIIFRKRAIEAMNVNKMKMKRANKVAAKRLKVAKKLMLECKISVSDAKTGQFYDEVLKALWGYAGDKLSMPVEQLSRDNISDKFATAGVDATLITQFVEALDDCEFARFAPGDKNMNMEKVYNSAADTITEMEEVIYKKIKSFSTQKVQGVSLLFIFLFLPLLSFAQSKAEADSAYIDEDYDKAIALYSALLKTGESADVYFNLGNSYYRKHDFAHAILNYERAHILDPGDDDIRFNLEMARFKTIDKIAPASEMFFVSWYRSLVNNLSVDGWARMAVICFALLLAALLLYLLSSRMWMRKTGFVLFVLMFVLFASSIIFAFQQKSQIENRDTAIVMSSAVTVRSTPSDNGTELFVIHEGTKVNILDTTMKDWCEVILDDGKRGWMERTNLEVI